MVVAVPRNYSSQKSYCRDVLSGTLVAHSSREKQLLVGGTDRRCWGWAWGRGQMLCGYCC